ncbi:probable G-protein coupled receptor B0563.6 [Panulirus ornatus]|uniref:probable G-protein coupled receptor B0563.6 n=1 Tax=Panulirus ornatus TaxID=150431 RepID=UPI003A86FF73
MQSLCYCLHSLNVTETWHALHDTCHVTYEQVLPVVMLVAVVTNVTNVTVLLLRAHPKGRPSPTPTRRYLLSLGVSHCFVSGVVVVGLAVRRRVGVTYALAFYLAHLEEPLYHVFNCSCSYIILGLSADRFRAVCRPDAYSAAEAYGKAPVRIALAYALPAVMYLPSCFSLSPVYSARHRGWGVAEGPIFKTPGWRAWSVLLEVVHRIVPCVFLVALNLRILRAVARLKSTRASMMLRGEAARRAGGSRHEQRVIYLLLALTLTFLLTNVPATSLKMVYALQNQHCLTNLGLEVARAIANGVEMAGVCSDFFLYFVMNPEYRRDLHALALSACRLCACCAPLTARCPVKEESGDQRSTQS